jgi:hypothetical protein
MVDCLPALPACLSLLFSNHNPASFHTLANVAAVMLPGIESFSGASMAVDSIGSVMFAIPAEGRRCDPTEGCTYENRRRDDEERVFLQPFPVVPLHLPTSVRPLRLQ